MSASPNDFSLDEASRWFAKRRRGMMTLDERAGYEAWRLDPANASAMAELEGIWAVLDTVKDRVECEADVAPAKPRVRMRRSALFAVVCAASLGLGMLSYSGDAGFWTTLNWVER